MEKIRKLRQYEWLAAHLRKYRWLAAYLLYIGTVLFVSHPLVTPFAGWKITDRLEASSLLGLGITYFICQVAFLFGKQGVHSLPDRIWTVYTLAAFILCALLIFDLRVRVIKLESVDRVWVTFGFVLAFTIIDFWRLLLGAEVSGDFNLKATLIAADLPLVIGLAFVLILGGCIGPLEGKDMFLGGALALKLGYYYGSFCFINTFLRPATADEPSGIVPVPSKPAQLVTTT